MDVTSKKSLSPSFVETERDVVGDLEKARSGYKRDADGLWSIPLSGGEERKVLDSVAPLNFNWTVAAGGIYHFDFAAKPGAPKPGKFYSFKTGKINQIGAVEPTVSQDYSSISVSPDGRWLLYSYIASINSDVMMVDHFR